MTPTFICFVALTAATVVMAEQPQNDAGAGGALPAALSAPAHAVVAPKQKPNIVYILADDMGYADAGFNGGTQIQTPNLNRLAQAGTILSSFYGQPLCSPLMPDQTETPRMKAWCDLHYGLFLHFNLNTFVGNEPQGAALQAKNYAPTALDVDSWVRLAKDAGMKYAVLTTKHRLGFCLWDSKVPWQDKEFDFDVAASGNTNDVVRLFMDACTKYGIVPGLYYNLRDAHADAKAYREHSHKVPLTKDYFDLVKAHLTELTTRNPDCHYYWIDHPSSATAEQLADIYELLRRADPRNIVQFNAHLAHPWNKSEGDDSTHGPGTNAFEKSHEFGFPTDVIGSENRLPPGPVPRFQSWQGRQYFVGYEHCAMLGGSWFDSQKVPGSTKGPFDLYQKVRNNGGNLLLDIGPDKQGRIDEKYAKFLIELKAQIEPFEASLAKSKQ